MGRIGKWVNAPTGTRVFPIALAYAHPGASLLRWVTARPNTLQALGMIVRAACAAAG